jgi:hypothetical protein
MNRNPTDCASVARQNADVIKHALKTKKNAGIAADMGKSPSVVSELKDSEIEKHASLAAACGIRYVPVEKQVFPVELVDALMTVNRNLSRVVTGEQLAQDN